MNKKTTIILGVIAVAILAIATGYYVLKTKVHDRVPVKVLSSDRHPNPQLIP